MVSPMLIEHEHADKAERFTTYTATVKGSVVHIDVTQRSHWAYQPGVDASLPSWVLRLLKQLYYCFWRSAVVKLRQWDVIVVIWCFVGLMVSGLIVFSFYNLPYTEVGFSNRCALLTVFPFALCLFANIFFEQDMKNRNVIATDRCRTLSSKVGMPSGRVRPSPFGTCTLQTGGAR